MKAGSKNMNHAKSTNSKPVQVKLNVNKVETTGIVSNLVNSFKYRNLTPPRC